MPDLVSSISLSPDNSATPLRIVTPVELSSKRILLRPYRIEDAAFLFSAATESVETVGRWMPWCHAGYTQAESVAWIEKCQTTWKAGDAYAFAMFDAANEYVGGAGLNQINRIHNLANLGYWVRQSCQRHGLATAAVQLLARFAFETVGLTRVEIVAATENAPSRRVAEKAGAQFECLARNRLIIHSVPLVAALYSLVPSDVA
jgi:ribosomal-protein-serine acetyltransferase